MVEGAHVLKGGCHCGNVSVSFATALPAASFRPRACDCAFCTRHGAMYVSDPAGRLLIEARVRDGLRTYRQGSNTADFLFCATCGILLAVTCEREGATLGAVNARCLEALPSLGEPVTVSPQKLSREEKTARWQKIWTGTVEIRGAASAVHR